MQGFCLPLSPRFHSYFMQLAMDGVKDLQRTTLPFPDGAADC